MYRQVLYAVTNRIADTVTPRLLQCNATVRGRLNAGHRNARRENDGPEKWGRDGRERVDFEPFHIALRHQNSLPQRCWVFVFNLRMIGADT